MRRLKAFLGTLLAVVVLGTASLHILAHPDLTEASCAVCHMQEACLPGAPAPAVFPVAAPTIAVAPPALPAAAPVPVRAESARAPPSALS